MAPFAGAMRVGHATGAHVGGVPTQDPEAPQRTSVPPVIS